ncbi:hypothetical protein ACFSKY_03675 [Azotobacter chroococcum]|uniref:Uncharacterized protein n=1 Tax=Azotobacter chroococcum TaxID=353 RepID=A0A4R1PSS0_9GAMM|nr:hypothetical protein [Azotobacter chroococcum]TCL34782.1 hypothetical protein EV691_101217 [Azotobacter chroococcum]
MTSLLHAHSHTALNIGDLVIDDFAGGFASTAIEPGRGRQEDTAALASPVIRYATMTKFKSLMLEAEGGDSRGCLLLMLGQPVDQSAAMLEPCLTRRIEATAAIIDIGLSGGKHFFIATYAGSDNPLPSQLGAVRLNRHIEPLVLLHVYSNIGTIIIHIVSVIVMLACRNRLLGTYSRKILHQLTFRGKRTVTRHSAIKLLDLVCQTAQVN